MMKNKLKFLIRYLKDNNNLLLAFKLCFDKTIEYKYVLINTLPISVKIELSKHFDFKQFNWYDIRWDTEDKLLFPKTFEYLKPDKPITCLLT